MHSFIVYNKETNETISIHAMDDIIIDAKLNKEKWAENLSFIGRGFFFIDQNGKLGIQDDFCSESFLPEDKFGWK